MKKLLIVLLMLCLGLFAFGKGPAETEQEGPIILACTAPFGGAGTILGDKIEDIYTQYVVPQIKSLYGIDVEVVFYPEEEDLITAMRAGERMDVIHRGMGFAASYTNAEFADPLSLTAEYLLDFDPGLVGILTEGDQVYGLPATAWALPMTIWLDIFDAIGMSYIYEQGDWTYDEFYEAAKASALENTYGMLLYCANSSAPRVTLPFMSGFGFELYDENGNFQVLMKEGIEALNFTKKLIDEGLTPPGATTMSDSDMGPFIEAGNCMALDGHPIFAGMTNGVQNSVTWWGARTMSFPYPGGGKVPVGPNAVWIPKGMFSEDALTVLKFMVSHQLQTIFASGARFPSRKSVTVKADASWTTTADLLTERGALARGVGHPLYGAVNELWSNTVQGVWSGAVTAEEALIQFKADVEELQTE